MKDIINMRVKFREEYRPLAPAILHEKGAEYFEDYVDSPYMTQTFRTKGNLADIAPAVVHADGTARLQSVHASTNPPFADLIGKLNRRIDLPITLNTTSTPTTTRWPAHPIKPCERTSPPGWTP